MFILGSLLASLIGWAISPHALTETIVLATIALTICVFFLILALVKRIENIEFDLSNNENWLKNSLNLSSDWLWEFDNNYRFTEVNVNSKIPDEFRMRLEDMVGKTPWEIQHDQMPEAFWENFRQLLDTRQAFRIILPHISPDGFTLYYEVLGQPDFEKKDTFLGYRGIGRNATEHVLAEQSLRESEERFRQIFDTVGNISVRGYDQEGRILYWNKASEKIYGYPAEEVLGKYIEDKLFTPKARKTFARERASLLAGSLPPQARDYTATRKDGGKIAIYSTQIAITRHDATKEFYSIDLDLSEIKLLQDELAESKEHYQQLFNLSPEGVVVYSDQILRIANEATAKLLHAKSVNQLIGRSIFDFIPPQYRDSVKERLAALEASDSSTPLPLTQLKHLTVDGQVIYVETTATRITYKGKPAFLAALRDITDRKNAEKEIIHLNASLEERVRERTAELTASHRELEAFSYSVSHDLRSPLRSIDGFARIIEEDYGNKLDATGHAHLNRIRNASQRMAQLIDDMLDLARITRANLQRQHLNLSDLALAITANLQKVKTDKKDNGDRVHKVSFSIEPKVLVYADQDLIRIALEHLLRNAWKFTGNTPEAHIEFGVTDMNNQRAFYVRDNGAGFDNAYVGKLFHPFQRLHRSDEFTGNGIGLATVQRVIQRHGGQVWAEGAINKGASFYFTLPE